MIFVYLFTFINLSWLFVLSDEQGLEKKILGEWKARRWTYRLVSN